MIVTDKKILRQISKPVINGENINGIVDKLKEANETAWCNGCGLAAIQIGIAKRIAWCNIDGDEIILVNPEITYRSPLKQVEKEGCLSIPRVKTKVQRNTTIEVIINSFTRKKKLFFGFTARVLQHEIDHMNGILCIDKKFKTACSKKNKQTKQSRKKNRRK